jgi:hypothetical protein
MSFQRASAARARSSPLESIPANGESGRSSRPFGCWWRYSPKPRLPQKSPSPCRGLAAPSLSRWERERRAASKGEGDVIVSPQPCDLPPSSPGNRLNGISAASLRRPISRIGGRWCAGMAATRRATSARVSPAQHASAPPVSSSTPASGRATASVSSRAQRAPGRQPVFLGASHALPPCSASAAVLSASTSTASGGGDAAPGRFARRSARATRSMAHSGR